MAAPLSDLIYGWCVLAIPTRAALRPKLQQVAAAGGPDLSTPASLEFIEQVILNGFWSMQDPGLQQEMAEGEPQPLLWVRTSEAEVTTGNPGGERTFQLGLKSEWPPGVVQALASSGRTPASVEADGQLVTGLQLRDRQVAVLLVTPASKDAFLGADEAGEADRLTYRSSYEVGEGGLSPEVEPYLRRDGKCCAAGCDAPASGAACGGCGKAVYCGEGCRAADAGRHDPLCKRLATFKLVERADGEEAAGAAAAGAAAAEGEA